MVFRNIDDYAASLAANNRRPVTATAGIGTNAEQGNNYTVDLGGQASIGKTSTGGFTGMVHDASNLAGENNETKNIAAQPPEVDQSYYDALANKASAKAGNINLATGYGGNAMAGAKEGLAGSGSTAQEDAFSGAQGSDGARIVEEENAAIMEAAREAALEKAKEKATEDTGYIDDSMGDMSGFQDMGEVDLTAEISDYGGLGNDLYNPQGYAERNREGYFGDDVYGESNKWANIDAQQYAEDISAREAEILDATYKRMRGNQTRNMQASMGARGMGMGGAASAMAGDIAARAALDRANAGIGIRQGARGEALNMKQGALDMFATRDHNLYSGGFKERELGILEEDAAARRELAEAVLANAYDMEPPKHPEADDSTPVENVANMYKDYKGMSIKQLTQLGFPPELARAIVEYNAGPIGHTLENV